MNYILYYYFMIYINIINLKKKKNALIYNVNKNEFNLIGIKYKKYLFFRQ